VRADHVRALLGIRDEAVGQWPRKQQQARPVDLQAPAAILHLDRAAADQMDLPMHAVALQGVQPAQRARVEDARLDREVGHECSQSIRHLNA